MNRNSKSEKQSSEHNNNTARSEEQKERKSTQSTGAVKKTLYGKVTESTKCSSTHTISELPIKTVKHDASGLLAFFKQAPSLPLSNTCAHKSDLKVVSVNRGLSSDMNKLGRTNTPKLKSVQSKRASPTAENKNSTRTANTTLASDHPCTNNKIPALPCNQGCHSSSSCMAGGKMKVLPLKQVSTKTIPGEYVNVSSTSYCTDSDDSLFNELFAHYEYLTFIINELELKAQTKLITDTLSLIPAKSQNQVSAKKQLDKLKNVGSASSLTDMGLLSEAANCDSNFSSEAECPICLENLMEKTKVAITCGHVFCEDCIDALPKRNRMCPVCRKKFTKRSLIALHM